MLFTKLLILNENLIQALEMSLYTWAFSLALMVVVYVVDNYFFAPSFKLPFYTTTTLVVAAYTLVTSWLWFYYFVMVLFFPFFALQLFLTYKLYQLKPTNKIKKIAIGLFIFTGLFSILTAKFFSIF